MTIYVCEECEERPLWATQHPGVICCPFCRSNKGLQTLELQTESFL